MSEFEQDFTKPNRRISFNEKVHVFDMSKPAPSPKTPKRSKIITPILKQSPNTSSDEECDYLPPTYKQTQPIYKQSEPDCKQSRNTGTMQSKAFLDEVISELKNHQQKVRTIFFKLLWGIPLMDSLRDYIGRFLRGILFEGFIC